MGRPSSSNFSAWLRGGQTFGHTVAMVRGVVLQTLGWLFLPAIACYVWVQTKATDTEQQYGFLVLEARLLEWLGAPLPNQLSVPVPGRPRETHHVSDIPDLPFVRPFADAYFVHVNQAVAVWLIIAIIIIAFTAYYYTTAGHAKLVTRQVKGQVVVSVLELVQQVREFNAAARRTKNRPDHKAPRLVGVDYPMDGEFEHTMITGGIGSGKSVAIHKLIVSIRERGDRAIIYDPEGEYIRHHYDPATDVILNPFDDRSPSWSPFFDAQEHVEWDRLAHGIFEDPKHGDPYWTNASRSLFSWTCYRLQQTVPDATLTTALDLFYGSMDNLSALLRNSPAAAHISGGQSPRTTAIRSVLAAGVTPLVYLPSDREPFSIRRWINHPQRRPGFLFLSAPETHIATLRPLLGFWSDIAVSSLLARYSLGIAPHPTWLILDEFPSLGRVDSLADGPARLRKHGGAMVFGLQQVSQLKDIYGTERALTIMGQCTNKLVLRANDPDTAKTMSLMLGERIMHRVTENTTYGANTIRDGVGIAPKEEKEAAFLPTQILNFPALQGVIKLSNRRPEAPFPIATVKFKPDDLPAVAPAYVPRSGPDMVETFMSRHKRPTTQPGSPGSAQPAPPPVQGASAAGGRDGPPPPAGAQATLLSLVVDNTATDQAEVSHNDEKTPGVGDLPFEHRRPDRRDDQAMHEAAATFFQPSEESAPSDTRPNDNDIAHRPADKAREDRDIFGPGDLLDGI
jgi:type IV conjugative transfer system coupling protein TraD